MSATVDKCRVIAGVVYYFFNDDWTDISVNILFIRPQAPKIFNGTRVPFTQNLDLQVIHEFTIFISQYYLYMMYTCLKELLEFPQKCK